MYRNYYICSNILHLFVYISLLSLFFVFALAVNQLALGGLTCPDTVVNYWPGISQQYNNTFT